VASAILGPKSVDQLTELLASADLRLDGATLDVIDAIVPPGVNVNPGDGGYIRPELEATARRRQR
jgi:hypothetical protein